ncbi:MAG: CHAD domain-containing protein [Rhodobacteraceae bacterium]|nr:MAG: CHAD domain-containing protein [Paracoccaceae bacterium]
MSLAASKSDKSAKAALQRVLSECVQKGLAEAQRTDAIPTVHELRKRTKEVRGLLRLLHPGLAGAKSLDHCLRDASRGLSETRDLEVMSVQFDALTAKLRDPNRFAGLRWQIFDEFANRCHFEHVDALTEYISCFQDIEREFEEFALDGKASHLLWNGIFSTYRKAQGLHVQAEASLAGDFDATPFHEMRKRVKHHWYQARFLARIRPKKMALHIKRIDDLGEALGDHNDFDVLMEFLDSCDALSREDIEAREIFRGHLMARRRKLATYALKLADKALARPPEKLVATWQDWWRDWRKG